MTAAGIGDLAGVLAAAFLLGVEIWVVSVLLIAWLVARPGPIGPGPIARASTAFVVSAALYVVLVVAIGLALTPR